MTQTLESSISVLTDRLSKAGGRQVNEDTCDFAEVANAACWVVADGLGGHEGGKAASSIAVEAVLASFRANPESSPAALKTHLEAAQDEILRWQKKDANLSNMRTTVVVLLTDFRHILWAHVGDSRIYCLEGGRISFRTQDHSVVQALVNAADLSPDQIPNHVDRNRLLRCLGDSEGGLRPTILEEQRILYRGTAFLLCTDGFWDYVTETEIETDFAKATSPPDWLARMEARLLERAKEGHDNYTAVAVFFDSQVAPLPPTRPLQPQRRKRSPVNKIAMVMGCLVLALFAGGVVWRTFPFLKEQTAKVTSLWRNPAVKPNSGDGRVGSSVWEQQKLEADIGNLTKEESAAMAHEHDAQEELVKLKREQDQLKLAEKTHENNSAKRAIDLTEEDRLRKRRDEVSQEVRDWQSKVRSSSERKQELLKKLDDLKKPKSSETSPSDTSRSTQKK